MKTKQKRYEKHGTVISVRLPKPHNDYQVYAMIKKENNELNELIQTFDVSFYLCRDDIQKLDMVDDNEYRFESNLIFSDVMDFIYSHYERGFFKKAIERYEFEVDMCCVGIDVIESRKGV